MCPETKQEQGSTSKPGRLELYFFPECPYCRKVLGAIDDLGLGDRVILHDTRNHPKEKEALIELTGKTQVPCLVVDGDPVHESEEIKRYLYQTFGA